MHFPRLAIVLMAAALSAVANAGGGLCTHMNAKKPVPSVEADMIWMNRAVVKLMNGMLGDLLDIMKGTPRKRDEEAMILYWLDCITQLLPPNRI